LSSIVITQSPVPEHAPDQSVKIDPDEGVAVNVTVLPCSYVSAQVEPQSIPDGLLVTIPSPVPDLDTRRDTDPAGEDLKTPYQVPAYMMLGFVGSMARAVIKRLVRPLLKLVQGHPPAVLLYIPKPQVPA
jgi:hypothetical protein